MNSDNYIILKKFPFLSLFKFAGQEYVGIIQHSNKNVVSVYVLNVITHPEQRREFIRLGNLWWSHSNRKVPINIFLKDEFAPYANSLRNYPRKDFELIQGHEININDLNQKRVKRRRIELIIEE
jgi:hypothetical protein